jgi:hypothetical protein
MTQVRVVAISLGDRGSLKNDALFSWLSVNFVCKDTLPKITAYFYKTRIRGTLNKLDCTLCQ